VKGRLLTRRWRERFVLLGLNKRSCNHCIYAEHGGFPLRFIQYLSFFFSYDEHWFIYQVLINAKITLFAPRLV
jgi:hypothetical protein